MVMPRLAGNSLAASAQPFLEQVETIVDQMKTLQANYMAACKVKREEITKTYTAAKSAGVNATALKGLVKKRQLERKIEDIPDAFDHDEAVQWRELCEAFGPLGEAAARAAGYPQKDGELDLRPDALRRKEIEEATGKPAPIELVGRGPVETQHPVDGLAS